MRSTAMATAIATVVCLLASSDWAARAAEPVKSEYGILADRPNTGSLLRRETVTGSPIPVNKRYSEMTIAERAVIHAQYQSIKPGDEPPFPVDGLKPVFEAIHQGQQKLLVSGKLFLAATINAKGNAISVKVYDSPSHEMAEFASSVLLLTKYKPAVCSGKPCQMDFPLRETFSVE